MTTITVKPASLYISHKTAEAGNNYKPAGSFIHRMQFKMDNLATTPAELFALKISQSTNPNKAGRVIFKWFSYKVGANAWSDLAPDGVTLGSDLTQLRDLIASRLAATPDVDHSFNMNLPGAFGNIDTASGRYHIFDNNEYPNTSGYPGYYLRPDADVTITLKPALKNGNQYYQVNFSTHLGPDQVFVRNQRAQSWGEDQDTGLASTYAAPQAAPTFSAPQAPTFGAPQGAPTFNAAPQAPAFGAPQGAIPAVGATDPFGGVPHPANQAGGDNIGAGAWQPL